MLRLLKWLLHEAQEKVNFAATYREIVALGKKHGKRFFWFAIIWEAMEDILFPGIALYYHMPSLALMFVFLHFEPLVYPIFFWCCKMWDRAQGREPWEPDRSAQSAYWRSAVKVAVYQFTALGWLSHFIPWKPLAIFTVMISLFGFVHERIWHDSNYGIRLDDLVDFKRVGAKTFTFLSVSAMVLYPFLTAFSVPLQSLLFALLETLVMYVALEMVWSKSLWGISQTHPTN